MFLFDHVVYLFFADVFLCRQHHSFAQKKEEETAEEEGGQVMCCFRDGEK